jgi:hypothetical protein
MLNPALRLQPFCVARRDREFDEAFKNDVGQKQASPEIYRKIDVHFQVFLA